MKDSIDKPKEDEIFRCINDNPDYYMAVTVEIKTNKFQVVDLIKNSIRNTADLIGEKMIDKLRFKEYEFLYAKGAQDYIDKNPEIRMRNKAFFDFLERIIDEGKR